MAITFAIIQERKNPPDKRVAFDPMTLRTAAEQFPDARFIVETSQVRVFPDDAYAKAGFEVTDDISGADIMLGVKEVPKSELIANKKYFFFSHTIKKQPYNRDLLKTILDKKIELYDHETLIRENGSRLIGFGRYAGIVGAYNGFKALGDRDGLFALPKMESLPNWEAAQKELRAIQDRLPPINIIITGTGKVTGGIREVLETLNIRELRPKEFLQLNLFDNNQTVFTALDVMDYYKHKDGSRPTKKEVYNDPSQLESDFMKYAQVGHMLITGHFYGNDAPYLFTREDARNPFFNLRTVADVSCDIDGPIASTIRPSTIADPVYGYDPATESEVPVDQKGAITVMAVDNLPCELPSDASQGFGTMFLEHVLPAFFNGDADGVLERARMTTSDGNLTERFAYLQDWVDGKED